MDDQELLTPGLPGVSEWFVRIVSGGDAPEARIYNSAGIVAHEMDLVDAERLVEAHEAQMRHVMDLLELWRLQSVTLRARVEELEKRIALQGDGGAACEDCEELWGWLAALEDESNAYRVSRDAYAEKKRAAVERANELRGRIAELRTLLDIARQERDVFEDKLSISERGRDSLRADCEELRSRMALMEPINPDTCVWFVPGFGHIAGSEAAVKHVQLIFSERDELATKLSEKVDELAEPDKEKNSGTTDGTDGTDSQYHPDWFPSEAEIVQCLEDEHAMNPNSGWFGSATAVLNLFQNKMQRANAYSYVRRSYLDAMREDRDTLKDELEAMKASIQSEPLRPLPTRMEWMEYLVDGCVIDFTMSQFRTITRVIMERLADRYAAEKSEVADA